jgi:serine/threonine protein phosphatase PrpC
VKTVDSATLLAAAASDVGRMRRGNEDAFICEPERGIFAVIDGVGGHAGGAVAAGIARSALELRLRRETGTVEDRLREAIAAANASILEEAGRVPALQRMACVLTAAVVTPGHVVAGHVGDTRLYKIDAFGFRKLTHDHSPVGILEDGGQLQELEAMHHPDRNQVFREVGTTPRQPTEEQFIETVTEPFGADHALLLCSDGLTDQVPAGEIEAIIRRNGADLDRSVQELVTAANRAGGKDNVTVLLVAHPLFGQRPAAPALDAHPHGTTSELRPPAQARSGDDDDARQDDGRWWQRQWGWRGYVALASAIAVAVASGLWLAGGGMQELRLRLALLQGAGSIRTLHVNTAGVAGTFPTIAQALAVARPGDVIEVAPGTYEVRIVMRSGVRLRAETRRGVVLQPPANAAGPWTAVSATAVRSGGLSGFSIQGSETAPLAVGISLVDADVEIDDVSIEGSRVAAVQFSRGSASRLRSSDLSGNRGPGIVVDGGSTPEILHNVVVRNGTTVPRRAGIALAGAGAGTVIEGNIIRDNGEPGIAGLTASEAANAAEVNSFDVPRAAPARPR